MKWGADKSLSQAGMNKSGVREKQQSKQQSKAAIKGNKGKKQGKASRKSKQKKQAEKATKHPVDLYFRGLSEDCCVLRLDQQDRQDT